MSKRIVFTPKAAPPVGPYNQAVVVNERLVYTSGQIPIDPNTGQILHGEVDGQTLLVLNNLKAVLEAAGSGLDKVVKTTVFLKDMNDFGKMNEVYAKFFPKDSSPARSTVEVARLPKDVRVEIEAVAVV
jgi:2-iminobutanoate/2-iminopropanoate deaminase